MGGSLTLMISKFLKVFLNILSLGNRFGLPINPNNKKDHLNFTLDVLKNFELNNYRISDDILNDTRCLISNSMHKFLRTNTNFSLVNKYILSHFDM